MSAKLARVRLSSAAMAIAWIGWVVPTCILALPAAAAHPEYQPIKFTWVMTGGGRLDWSHGGRNVIAFDRLGPGGVYDVYTMNPDGSGVTPLTVSRPAPLPPNTNIGNPEWHPSGNYLVIQVEKAVHPPASAYEVSPGYGMYNDLWIMTADGQTYYQLTDLTTTVKTAVLHPHFNLAGTKVCWAQQDQPLVQAVMIADFVTTPSPHLENITAYQPGSPHYYYETHHFNPRDQNVVLFTSMCQAGVTFNGQDIFTYNTASQSGLTNLTTSPDWDEHAHYSPDGQVIIWMSSRDTGASGNTALARTDYWVMNPDGADKQRLTYFNQAGHSEFMSQDAIAADSAFSPDGSSLMALVRTLNDPLIQERIVRIDFAGPPPKPLAAPRNLKLK